jgi:PAS domain S-box-containing protein
VALRDSEARYRAIFEQAGVGVVEVDAATGRFVRVNTRFCAILGYAEAELLALGFQQVTHPGDLERDLVQAGRVSEGELPVYSVEKRYLRKDGSTVWGALTTRALLQADGQAGTRVSIVEDITARKQAELEVQQLTATLERRVAERTAELQAANAELESFAYAVSHDLRAPLRAMAGFSSALVEDCGPSLSPEAKEDLDHIIEASLRMGGLIDALLKLSRTTRCDMERVPVDLSSLGRAILADLARSEPDRRVQTRVEPGIRAEGDPHMLEAALANLLGNAWKYTSKTPGARIDLATDHAAGVRRIRIQDNGCGFDMAHSEKLFKPFQRLHRQDEFPGLGIGLATAQRIVLRHGGTLEAASAPGEGAVFFLCLPEPSLEPS